MSDRRSIYDVIQDWCALMSDRMPTVPQPSPVQDPNTRVGVHYSHPGIVADGGAMVWVEDIIEDVVYRTQRAGSYRRDVDASFLLVIAAEISGENSQSLADRAVQEIRSIVEEDISTEKHLHAPEFVLWAKLDQATSERGRTANGAGSRLTCRISCHYRYT